MIKDIQISFLLFFAIIVIISFGAGLLGSLTGLGGGIVIVPFLTILMGVDIHYAIGASLISVLTTSSGAAAAHAKEGFTNVKIGMILEIAATMGALGGAFIAGYIAPPLISLIFGLVLLHSAYMSVYSKENLKKETKVDKISELLHLDGSYPSEQGVRTYHVRAVPAGFSVMFAAGILSGLLGIGSGALKVIGMDKIMKIPFKVSTATSNFMIGITAAASAGVYLHRGNIDPMLVSPVMIGVLAGSLLGGTLLTRVKTNLLRILFAITIAVLGIEMLYKGVTGLFK